MSRLLLGIASLSVALLVSPASRSMAADEANAGPSATQVAKPKVAKPGPLARHAPDPSAGRDLRRAVKAALAQPLGKIAEEQQSQARELLALHAQIVARESLTPSERERLLMRLRGRLARLAKSLARSLADDRANESNDTPDSESVATGSASASLTSTSNSAADLTAQAPPPGGAGGAAQSDAQELIDLIQATIAPSSWDVNGGPGTIVYWPLGQALVVRQTSEVHEELGGVVGRLRN